MPTKPDVSHPGVELLGQKISYPTTKWGAVSVLGVVLGICILVALLTYWAKPKDVREFIQMGIVGLNGKVESTHSQYVIQFWTPSAKTKSANATDLEEWEKLDSDDKVIKFGEHLRVDKEHISGFRRYEVYGAGRAQPKYGYWWVLTVSRDYTLPEFVGTYRSFWGSTKPIYVEVLNEGGYW